MQWGISQQAAACNVMLQHQTKHKFWHRTHAAHATAMSGVMSMTACLCVATIYALHTQAVKKEVDTAVIEAKASPVPEAEMLWKNIYKDPLGSSVKGLDSKTHIKL